LRKLRVQDGERPGCMICSATPDRPAHAVRLPSRRSSPRRTGHVPFRSFWRFRHRRRWLRRWSCRA